MSDDEIMKEGTSETQMLHAEYKDGQLQIVEVTPFDRDKMYTTQPDSILPDIITTEDGDQQKYLQVLDIGSSSGASKGLVELDLLNLTLVKCADGGEESYRLVTNSEDIPADATVTCVLQSSDGEEHDNQDYVMVDGEQGLVFLQSSSPPREDELPPDPTDHATLTPLCTRPPAHAQPEKKQSLTPQQLLEKAKALKKAKALMSSQIVRPGKRGRRRAGDLPPPHELLASPNFKLYLYSCKLCSYKCNAIKELQAHRTSEHCNGRDYKNRASAPGARVNYSATQCARCPFRGASHSQLVKHVQAKHLGQEDLEMATESITFTNKVSLDSKEVEEADVLVCGACGYESSDRAAFRQHIEAEHGATTT